MSNTVRMVPPDGGAPVEIEASEAAMVPLMALGYQQADAPGALSEPAHGTAETVAGTEEE